MKKIYLIILIVILFVSAVATCTFVYINGKNKDNTISSDYIIVFKSESAEVVHTTYVYEVVKKKKKTTYKYINTTSTTSTYDSIVAEEKINKKGSTKKKKKVFEIAKKHGAYSYVKDIKEDKIYTIDEYKNIFK